MTGSTGADEPREAAVVADAPACPGNPCTSPVSGGKDATPCRGASCLSAQDPEERCATARSRPQAVPWRGLPRTAPRSGG